MFSETFSRVTIEETMEEDSGWPPGAASAVRGEGGPVLGFFMKCVVVVRGRRWVEERQLRKEVRWWVSWDPGGGGGGGGEGGSSLDHGTWGRCVQCSCTLCTQVFSKQKDILIIL